MGGNFRQEKDFANACCWRKLKFLPSEIFITLNVIGQAVLTVPHQSGVVPGIKSLFFLDLQPSLILLLLCFQVVPMPPDQQDATVNRVQRAEAKETRKQVIDVH